MQVRSPCLITPVHSRPKKNTSFVVGDNFAAGKHGGDQVRGTKYEVKELGATELRRRRKQSRNSVWESNPCTCEVEAPLVRRASVTRMRIGIAAFFENFMGTDVMPDTSRYVKMPSPEVRSDKVRE